MNLSKQHRNQNYKGFTLIELMVVIGIIALLSAIVLPVLARARREGHKVDTISNLKQCGLSLSLYCEDYDGVTSMPTYEAANKLLKTAPTCDKADFWRASCTNDWGKPLIGSYGYVRGLQRYSTPEGWQEYLDWTDNPHSASGSLLVSIFYANNTISAFHGERPDLKLNHCSYLSEPCQTPDHLVRLRMDGSVATTSWKRWRVDTQHSIFDWEGLFFFAE